MLPAWRATFVAPAFPAGGDGDPAPYLRHEFTATGPVRRATLHVTGLGLVDPYLNGTRVGDEVLAPGWTSYRHRLVVSSHDVTTLVAPGRNALGAVLGQGWAVGRLGWEGRRQLWAPRPALFAQLDLEYQDGSTESVTTDGTWRASTGAVLSNGIYDGETYDARLEPAGWAAAGFDDSGWTPVEPAGWDLGTLVEPLAPPIRRTQEVTPVEMLTTPSGRTVADFGQVLTGWVRLRVDGPAGTAITLRHAEVMTGGELDVTTLRTAQATDRYILRDGGPQTWEPRFTFHGFRYVEVDGWPGPLDPAALTAVVVHSDMRRTGWLRTSHPLLNRLHDNAVWSMRGNFAGVPTDCPQRDERLGWTGDINAFAPTAAFLFDVRGVLGSWLADLSAEQAAKGYVPWVVPDVLSTPSSPTALWSDVAVSLPWTLYQEYGDEEILRRAYPSMTAFVRQVEALLDEDGLWSSGFQFGDWLDPAAPHDNPAGGRTDRHLVACAYFCKVTHEMAATATLLGHTADAAHFHALAGRVRTAFRREYVTASGRVVNESATAYALAICFGLLEPEQEARAGDLLAAQVAKAGYTIATGFAGTPLVLHALSRTGHLDEAYLLLLETRCPSFLYPVTAGATTIWERWDSVRPDGTLNPSEMTSLNHYALGAVLDWLHRVVGGLTALEPGYRRLRLAPRPGGGLTEATLRHETVHGLLEAAWRIEGTTVDIRVLIPQGTTAEVVLPLHPDARTETVPAGEHSWHYDLPAGSGSRRQFSMDTPLNQLAGDPATWKALTAVFDQHLPGIPIDGGAPEAAAISLNGLLGYVPGASDGFRNALAAALATAPAPDSPEGSDSHEGQAL